jgi:hypothetical protein
MNRSRGKQLLGAHSGGYRADRGTANSVFCISTHADITSFSIGDRISNASIRRGGGICHNMSRKNKKIFEKQGTNPDF